MRPFALAPLLAEPGTGAAPVPVGVLVDPTGREASVAPTGAGQVAVEGTREVRVERRAVPGGRPEDTASVEQASGPTPDERPREPWSFQGEPGRPQLGS